MKIQAQLFSDCKAFLLVCLCSTLQLRVWGSDIPKFLFQNTVWVISIWGLVEVERMNTSYENGHLCLSFYPKESASFLAEEPEEDVFRTFSNYLRRPRFSRNITPDFNLVPRVFFCFCFVRSRNQKETNDTGDLIDFI